ncbi:Mediator of RNA polymerase II transcription subunit like [Actinidia chinensis var. chinensis]|uniref:Mediator of RNA polymerase II transcription subunit like n=1 Tax=Actinidia chinensis var. chinensis TaxID=1590841 RepID=A0A2R6RYB2_ACTCC|nr:Mediator of RNA polymerase II transcription subunit like [Actinidia chinensis var. chinensis]
MASLASRLFDVSPNRSHWVTAFRGSLPPFLSNQTQTLTPMPPDSSPSSTKEILSLFTSLQTQLFEAVVKLQEILDLQDDYSCTTTIATQLNLSEIHLLPLPKKSSPFLHPFKLSSLKLLQNFKKFLIFKMLFEAVAKLQEILDLQDDYSCTTTIAAQLNLSDILSYAHRISYTTFAPQEFGAGQAPLRGAPPPAPQEEQLRASLLYVFAELDGLLPPNIVVPSGWRPGMPVELPSDLPIVPPPGWKLGDPVPLPPLDALPVPGRVEEPPPRPIPAPGIPKAPEPIQVQHVQLNIDDDSSDYSSDMGSSDDED